MQAGKKGYSQADNALDLGANTLNLILGSFGSANGQFLKWSSLFVPELLSWHKATAPPEKMTDMVKLAAALYGSDLTGVANLDTRWIYSHDAREKPFLITDDEKPAEEKEAFIIPKTMNKAVVMAVAMDEEMLASSPAIPAGTASSLGYSRMGIAAVSLAEYIRALGYAAIPCMNDTALSIPLAIDAGLGELGRHGLLITPEYGSSVRLCKVLTDMPLVPDKPISFGVKEFCDNCLLCARHCPAQAIGMGDQTTHGPCGNNNHGVRKWYIHAEKCLRFWQINGSTCANCLSVCPFAAGFVSEHCQLCEKCDTTCGCALQANTYQRIKYGYLHSERWGDTPEVQAPRRRGL